MVYKEENPAKIDELFLQHQRERDVEGRAHEMIVNLNIPEFVE